MFPPPSEVAQRDVLPCCGCPKRCAPPTEVAQRDDCSHNEVVQAEFPPLAEVPEVVDIATFEVIQTRVSIPPNVILGGCSAVNEVIQDGVIAPSEVIMVGVFKALSEVIMKGVCSVLSEVTRGRCIWPTFRCCARWV